VTAPTAVVSVPGGVAVRYLRRSEAGPAQSPCSETGTQERTALFDNRTSSGAVVFAKPDPRLDDLLSRDKQASNIELAS
jgi:hypothetical protein